MGLCVVCRQLADSALVIILLAWSHRHLTCLLQSYQVASPTPELHNIGNFETLDLLILAPPPFVSVYKHIGGDPLVHSLETEKAKRLVYREED